ncbi:WRKY transcription factor 1-like [Humulus lupulus]|uniref:WRKY transcription factor 1-like n=1 Tax=Humulus lupulus TaxID=3486 RepID=UPI002B4156C8|nr:WRKY transcription factor 1-like [Humulus lupulus]
MVPLGESVADEAPDKQQETERLNTGNHVSREISGTDVCTPQSDKRGKLTCIKSEKAESVRGSALDAFNLNQLEKSSPKIPMKASKGPETGVRTSQSGQEGSTPSIVREKVSEDGYNWRKYGQKLVKGNEYVRSYYRCTHPNCLVKKQLECSHEGKIVDIVYFGQHDHPKLQHNIPVAVGFVLSIVEEKQRRVASLTPAEGTSVDEHRKPPTQNDHVDTPLTPKIAAMPSNDSSKSTLSQSNKIKDDSDDDPDFKRQKKDKHNIKTTTEDKPTSTSGPRVVVQTLSEVDIVNDGFRWRKYGQKMVKGNLNPRSYYRCSNSGCPVKKHVERASHDTKVVMATYEGQHNHDMPPGRTVTHNVSESSAPATADQVDNAAKSDGKIASLDMVVNAILEHPSKPPKEQPNGELRTGSSPNNMTDSNMAVESCLTPDGKPDKLENGKSVAKEERDPFQNVAVESGNGNNNLRLTSWKKSKRNGESSTVKSEPSQVVDNKSGS